MKILVIGADGQLGRTLNKVSVDYPQHQFLFIGREKGDITNREFLEEIMDDFAAELIINCAAYTAVDRAESDPKTADKVNRGGVELLAKLAKRRNAGLIHVSTDYVFDGEASEPYEEQSPTNPKGIYGETKLAGERAIEQAGTRSVVVRTSWLYSEFGHNFVKTMLKLGTERGALRVVADQYGAPTYTDNLAHALLAIAQRPFEGFNVIHYRDRIEGATKEQGVTWCDFAREIFKQAKIDVSLEPISTADYPTEAKRPQYSLLSIKRAEQWGIATEEWRESLGRCLVELKREEERVEK